MKPFGSWFNESAKAVQPDTKIELKTVMPIDYLIGALQEVADTALDCGCVPCLGQCWGKDELRDEIYALRDLARAALKRYESQS